MHFKYVYKKTSCYESCSEWSIHITFTECGNENNSEHFLGHSKMKIIQLNLLRFSYRRKVCANIQYNNN